MRIEIDTRNLAKWLNEEQTDPIDKQALARVLAYVQRAEQPSQQQEPYGWKVYGVSTLFTGKFAEDDAKAEAKRIGGTCIAFPLYTSKPASKPWVGLTEQERNDIENYCEMIIGKAAFDAIEAKLKEKNNGEEDKEKRVAANPQHNK